MNTLIILGFVAIIIGGGHYLTKILEELRLIAARLEVVEREAIKTTMALHRTERNVAKLAKDIKDDLDDWGSMFTQK